MKLTLISPWYGPDTAGGAETQARSLAQALRRKGADVRVWSSTGRDSFHPNELAYYPPGHAELDGVPIWRFRPSASDPQGIPAFFRKHPEYLPDLSHFSAHELRLLASLLSSDELYTAVLRERENSIFIPLPYPFPTTFWTTMLAPARTAIIPCLHDEPYARYAIYEAMFLAAKALLANTHTEAALIERLYTIPVLPRPEDHLSQDRKQPHVVVAGEGIDLTPRGNPASFYERLHVSPDPAKRPALLLYVGRRDAGKNIPLLLAYLREYTALRGKNMRLVLIGPGELDISAVLTDPESGIVIDLGFCDEQTKYDAYAATDLFIQPSINESFSIVLMEAWLQGTAALVHRDCAVTTEHVYHSGGGLAFGSFGEFAAALDLLLGDTELRHQLGQNGQAYVKATCDWDQVAQQTLTALQEAFQIVL